MSSPSKLRDCIAQTLCLFLTLESADWFDFPSVWPRAPDPHFLTTALQSYCSLGSLLRNGLGSNYIFNTS